MHRRSLFRTALFLTSSMLCVRVCVCVPKVRRYFKGGDSRRLRTVVETQPERDGTSSEMGRRSCWKVSYSCRICVCVCMHQEFSRLKDSRGNGSNGKCERVELICRNSSISVYHDSKRKRFWMDCRSNQIRTSRRIVISKQWPLYRPNDIYGNEFLVK